MTGPIIAKIDRADLGQAATRLGSKAGSPRHDRPRRSNGRAALAGLVALLALALPAAPTAWAQMPDGSATGDSPASPALPAQRRTWVFEARLDGKPIGDHRYVLTEQGDRRVLRSSARLEVKLLGLTVYRYSFEATEHWRGDCLLGLQADTLDDGTPLKVRASRAEGGTPAGPLRISGPKGELEAPGCVLSYAYWLPSALRSQKRLLNPQTGELEPVSVSPQGSEAVE
ncbi:MAG: hypothetical protein RL722_2429, partial [Pseudomonadota bacterium]